MRWRSCDEPGHLLPWRALNCPPVAFIASPGISWHITCVQRNIWKGASANLHLYWPGRTKAATFQHCSRRRLKYGVRNWRGAGQESCLEMGVCSSMGRNGLKSGMLVHAHLLRQYGFIFLSRLALRYGKALTSFPRERFAEVLSWYKSIKL